MTNSWCFVNGQIAKLADIEKMGYDEFSTKCHLTMPLKLYKYFSNKECMVNGRPINYSTQALQNNTVYMQTPTEFDDVYDSEISVDYLEYEKLENINYIIPGDSIVNFNLPYNDYYQTSQIKDTLSGSIASIDMINSSSLIYGRMPENNYEMDKY